MSRHTNVIGIHLVFERQGRVLLGRRSPDAAFAPDTWHLPAGHQEDESATACAAREAYEELGVRIAEDDLRLVHVLHYREVEDHQGRMQLFFQVTAWSGTPHNMEPDRCSALQWWPLDALPVPLVDYTGQALRAIATGLPYSQAGWPEASESLPDGPGGESVVAIVYHPGSGELLLHERDEHAHCWPEYWSLLGGRAEPGETPQDTVRRELLEEAQLRVDDDPQVVQRLSNPDSGQVTHVFAVPYSGTAEDLVLGEGRQLRFVAPADLDGYRMPPYLREVVDRWLAARAAVATSGSEVR
ncbi:NUDIX domain-containing protein [Streptomyces sp. NPDC059373]